MQAIQQQVADAGIRLKINSTEKTLYDQDRAACKMQAGTISFSQDYADPDDFTQGWARRQEASDEVRCGVA